jgi:thiosulfate reductase cytochrome b subunit
MKIELYIVSATLIGTLIGYLAAALMSSHTRRSIQKRTWAEARQFYLLAIDERKNSTHLQ